MQPGGPILNEIPGSGYFPHDEPDATAGPALPQASVARVAEPLPGDYQVVLTATSTTDSISGIDVTLERADYSVVSSTFTQNVVTGRSHHFNVTFDTSSTTAPLIQPAVPAWAPNTAYSVGDSASDDHLDYVCRQAHTSQVGWEPPNVPSLWARVP